MATAGRVAPLPRDKFVKGEPYEKLDVVEYNGNLYMAKKASSGVLPTDTEYWMLAIDLTGKLDTTGDTENNTVTFTSNDAEDPTAWQDVAVMGSKEKHTSLFSKISTMFSNMRYLYKLLGTADISDLGSVTQAIATLSGNVGNMKGISSSAAITTEGEYALDAREKNASVEGTLANQLDVLNSNLNSRRVDVIWTGRATSNTEITYDKSLDNYPTAKKLIFIFNNLDVNNTVHIEVPYHIWNQNTNYGAFSSYSDSKYVQLAIIPIFALSNVGCTLSWSSDNAWQYVLSYVIVEY